MKRPGRKYHRGAVAQDAIVAAAREIDEHGHLGFTLDKVAKRLGITAAALYRHYDNREALLKAVVWQTFLRFAAELDDAVLASPSPREVLLSLSRHYIHFALKNPGWFRLQFSRAGIALDLQHEEAELKYPALVTAAIGEYLGTSDQARIERVYLTHWALMHGVASLMLEDVWSHLKSDRARAAEAEALMVGYLDGLAPPPAPRRASR
jgi:AcrR family transcriptional regulator